MERQWSAVTSWFLLIFQMHNPIILCNKATCSLTVAWTEVSEESSYYSLMNHWLSAKQMPQPTAIVQFSLILKLVLPYCKYSLMSVLWDHLPRPWNTAENIQENELPLWAHAKHKEEQLPSWITSLSTSDLERVRNLPPTVDMHSSIYGSIHMHTSDCFPLPQGIIQNSLCETWFFFPDLNICMFRLIAISTDSYLIFF